MEIKIKSIKIKNFKGVASAEYDLSENKNIFEGEVGIGKTTVLDAITWCLFGKNFADEKQFDIKPIIDGVEKDELTPEVEIKLNDRTIERAWEKDLSIIKVDGVKFGVREFEEYLKSNFEINAEEFKSLSNIEYMANLNWKDLRSLIMSLIGEITNEEVYAKCDCESIKEKIESVGVEKTADDIRESKTKANDDIKKILGNIDQKNADIEKMVVNEDEQKELTSRKEDIKKSIDNYNELSSKKAVQDGEVKKIELLKNDSARITETIERNSSLKEEYQHTYDNSNVDVTIERANKKKAIDNDIEGIRQDIVKLDLENSSLVYDRTELEKQYNDELSKEVRIDNDRCSSCGQALPQDKVDEVLEKLKQEQKDRANAIVERAKQKKQRIEDNEVLIESKKKKVQELEEIKKVIDSEPADATQESTIQKTMKERIAEVVKNNESLANDKVSIDKEIAKLEEVIRTHEVIDVKDISELQVELESITRKLAVSDVLEQFKQQLKDLESQHKQLIQDKEALNIKEQQLIAFNSAKSEILRDKVKSNFKMVDFITSEETKEGKLVETFKLAYEGKQYSSLSEGQKVLLSLDLIDNIQRLKDKRIPMLVDKLESITRIPEIGTQFIGTRVKFQTNKSIELVKEEK